MAIARFLDCMCSALRASGLWLRYATLQNLIPSFPWIVPPALHPGTIQKKKKGNKFCHLSTLRVDVIPQCDGIIKPPNRRALLRNSHGKSIIIRRIWRGLNEWKRDNCGERKNYGEKCTKVQTEDSCPWQQPIVDHVILFCALWPRNCNNNQISFVKNVLFLHLKSSVNNISHAFNSQSHSALIGGLDFRINAPKYVSRGPSENESIFPLKKCAPSENGEGNAVAKFHSLAHFREMGKSSKVDRRVGTNLHQRKRQGFLKNHFAPR